MTPYGMGSEGQKLEVQFSIFTSLLSSLSFVYTFVFPSGLLFRPEDG
jgi:hypothetical protein